MDDEQLKRVLEELKLDDVQELTDDLDKFMD